MRVALVYDRINKWGGAEKVLLTLHEMFPEAPLFTSVYDISRAGWASTFPKVYTTFINKIPFAKVWHEGFGWLMPIAFETLDLDGFDVVISVTSEAAKGIIVKPGTKHICYCLTPTRYLWSHYETYFRNPMLKTISRPVVGYLKNWDIVASKRPDVVVAISQAVKKRIKKYYERDSVVIYPPVDSERFEKKDLPVRNKEEKYFLYVGRLTPYKEVDLLVKVFNGLREKLVIVGTGSEEKRLRAMANSNISFEGFVSEEDIPSYFFGAQALVFPGDEDFGMVMVESMASGTPVIAARCGGALDIIDEGKTGIFFRKGDTADLAKTILSFDSSKFTRKELIRRSKKFSKKLFKTKLSLVISGL